MKTNEKDFTSNISRQKYIKTIKDYSDNECDLEKSEFVVELDYNTKEQTRLLNLDCQPISKARSTPVKTVN